jgi:Na+/proline symporter
MGFSGLVAVSQNSSVVPDLAFFSLLLKEQSVALSIIILVLAISLTVSSIDTLINAISSLIVVDGNKVIKFKRDYLKLSKQIIILLSLITFFVASKGLSILYLFLLADLFCCAAVLTVFYSFYSKSLNEKNSYISIIIGLFAGILLFPSPDFSQSILVGMIFKIDFFPTFVSQSLLFCSFVVATFVPIVTWKLK